MSKTQLHQAVREGIARGLAIHLLDAAEVAR